MNRFAAWFSSCSRSLQIGIGSCFIHGLLLISLGIHHLLVRQDRSKKAIFIQTIVMSEPRHPNAKERLSIKRADCKEGLRGFEHKKRGEPKGGRSSAKPAKKPSQKTVQSKGIKGKEGKSKAALCSVEDEKIFEVENALKTIVQELELLTTLPKEEGRFECSVQLPQAIERKEENQTIASSYGEMVVAILKENLDLPELGFVVARIDIEPNGSVGHLEILEERSDKNSAFLKKRLQELSFPCFNEYGIYEQKLQFTVTFRNAE